MNMRPWPLVAALAVAGAPLAAQSPAATPVPASAPSASQRLAVAYLAFEYVTRDHPPEGEAAEAISQALDRIWVAFLGGRMEQALDSLSRLTARVLPDSAARARSVAAAERRYATLPAQVRSIAIGPGVPARIHVPRGNGPFAVVIALHGAGGTEQLFMEGFGAGVFRQMADEQGFIAVSPRARGFTAAAFDTLLSQLGREVPIDTMRIVVLGHAAGGTAAWELGRARTGRIAAVACIAALCGSAADSTPRPPALSVAGALDQVTEPARTEAAATAARTAGRSIEYVLVEGVGHTTIVGQSLPNVVTWLLNKSLGSAR